MIFVDRCGHRKEIAVRENSWDDHYDLLFRQPRAFVSSASFDPMLAVCYRVPFVECDYGSYYGERWIRPAGVGPDECVFGVERAPVTPEEFTTAARSADGTYSIANLLAMRKHFARRDRLHLRTWGVLWVEAWPENVISADERCVLYPDIFILDQRPSWKRQPMEVPPSDNGINGTVPLPAPDWSPPSPDTDTLDWHEQNKRINDLLMRGKLV